MAYQKSPLMPKAAPLVYSQTARRFHWATAALILLMLALGYGMGDDGKAIGLPDGLRGTMSTWHKLIGFCVLWLVLARLVYRLRHGAPASEPGLASWQKGASHATHWALYLLMILVPLGGWLGVSLYGARDIFGRFSLPAIAPVNQPLSETVFKLHELGAFLILLLVAVHFGAAVYHHLILKDGVLRRMWPGWSSER